MEEGTSSSQFHSHAREGGMLMPSLKVLCLHDGRSNAGELSDQLEVLGERLYENHLIDLVYVNAPLLMENDSPEDILHPLDSNPQRIWWEEKEGPQQEMPPVNSEDLRPGNPLHDDEPESQVPPMGKNFVGLDASLLLLRQVWNSMPFWGVLAVGRGAAVASFLPLLPVSPPPQFMIFVRGETILEETEPLVDEALSASCLHLLSTNPDPSSEKLARQFGGQVFTGATSNFTSKTLNVIGKVSRDAGSTQWD